MSHVGMQHVQLDEAQRTVRFLAAGVELNLGSIGKGYALDRAAELLQAEGMENFLLHGGNSSVLGRGAKGAGGRAQGTEKGSPSNEVSQGWWIGLRHPLEPERRIGEVRLRNRALGTSGSGTQFFLHEGRRYGHILDPRTGEPAEGAYSSTVAAATGAEADALATAFYVLGAERSLDYCRQHANIAAVIMSPAAENGRIEITLWGWAEDEIRLEADPSLCIRRVTA
jgi:FAD:protein FMN transferase